MTSHLIYAGVVFCLFLSCAIFSNILGVMIIAEINRKRPETSQVSYFGSSLPKTISIFKEYRALSTRAASRLFRGLLRGSVGILVRHRSADWI
jgi:hypothetical protein